MARTLPRSLPCLDPGHASAPAAPPRFGLFAWLRRRSPRIPKLDPETLTDALRRDLGLADGRIVPPRDPWRD